MVDIVRYAAGKASGVSNIELQGDSTLLVTWPGGFNPADGTPLPLNEQGFQIQDIEAMERSAEQAVESAEKALVDARARLEQAAILMDDAEAFREKINANLEARREAANKAKPT